MKRILSFSIMIVEKGSYDEDYAIENNISYMSCEILENTVIPATMTLF